MSATSPRPTPPPATSIRAAVEKMAAAQGAGTVVISAAIEAEVAQLPDDEEHEFLAALGLTSPASTG